MPNLLLSHVLGIVGGVGGGVLGYAGFVWLLGYGLYAIMLPGTLIGVGCGLLARHRSLARGLVCGVAALGLGLYTEWRWFPFQADESLAYFVTHLHQLRPPTLLLIGFGGLLAFWMGKDRFLVSRSPAQPPP